MERINQYEFYDLGRALGALARFEGDTSLGALFFDALTAQHRLNWLLHSSTMPLGVSRASAETLKASVDRLLADHVDETGLVVAMPSPELPIVPSYALDWFRNQLRSFETVFSAEMQKASIYAVPRRGIYSTSYLIDNADEAFPRELLTYIPEKTRDDWRAAGRCLAFSLFSASGFHAARAVEGTLEAYYQIFAQQQFGKTLKSWNDYIIKLKAQLEIGHAITPSKRVIAELEQMKDDYRNPLMHPRVMLFEADARMLFANGESLIILMAQEMKTAQGHMQSYPSLLQSDTA